MFLALVSVVAVAALYSARVVLVPLSPPVKLFERAHLGRVFSTLVVESELQPW